MSTPTTARGALLRRAGTLLVAAALVGAPATSAFADPTASPTTSPTADAVPRHPPRRHRRPTATASGDATPTHAARRPPRRRAPATRPRHRAPPRHPPARRHAEPRRARRLGRRRRTAVFGPLPRRPPEQRPGPARGALHRAARWPPAATTTSTPSGDFPDRGNTIDAILALDAAGTGQAAGRRPPPSSPSDLGRLHRLRRPDRDRTPAPSPSCSTSPSPRASTPPPSVGYDLRRQLHGLETAERSLLRRLGATATTPTPSASPSRSSACTAPASRVSADAARLPARPAVRRRRLPALHGRRRVHQRRRRRPGRHARWPSQALIAVGRRSSTAAGDGLDHLDRLAGRSGGVGGGGPSAAGVNANTTGLAGQAFLAGGRTAQARAAVAFLTDPAVRLRPPRRPCAAASPMTRRRSLRPRRPSGADRHPRPGPPLDRRRRSSPSPAPRWSTVTAAGADALAPARATSRCDHDAPTHHARRSSVDPTSTRRADRGRRRVRPVDDRRRGRDRLARPDRHRPAGPGPARPGCSSSSVAVAVWRLDPTPGGARLMRRPAHPSRRAPRRRRRRLGSGSRRARRGGGAGERGGLLGHLRGHRRRRHRRLDQHQVRLG